MQILLHLSGIAAEHAGQTGQALAVLRSELQNAGANRIAGHQWLEILCRMPPCEVSCFEHKG